jgi:hypothetical protein
MGGRPMTDAQPPLESGEGVHAAVALQVVEALRSGGGIASLRPLLEETSSLSPEQRDVIEFLELLDGLEDNPAADAAADVDELMQQQNAPELEALRDEVTDLREVNDATAAALGACRVCWGGDEICPVCAGQGRPGASLPDRRLYNELVEPAVQRMTAGRVDPPQPVQSPEEEAQ